MKIQSAVVLLASAGLLAAPSLIAQGRGGRGGGGGGGEASVPGPTSSSSFNADQVARGEKGFGAQCGSCHGANARGGKGKTEVDLLRSPMVLDDINGREIGEFLKFGRAEKGMPKFDLPQNTVEDMAAFLHRQIVAASERGSYQKLNVFSGNAKAGEAFFNGPVGKCNTCHSAAGDMKGLAAKHGDDAPTIQGLIVSGGSGGGRGGRGGRGRGGPTAAPTFSKSAVTATVTTKAGETVTGLPVEITDFVIVIQPQTGPVRSFLRQGEWPKVVEHNPLQAHVDLLGKYTDDDIHNLAAYLVSLK